MTNHNWNLPCHILGGHPLLETAGYTPLLSAVLAARGIDTPEKAKTYLSRSIELIADPFELADMDRAVIRIKQALEKGEIVSIYGDYDVDGITASCLVYDYLLSRGARCGIYIPDRIEEGYGVNTDALDALYRQGTSLVITVDCGVTAVKETEYARTLGMDIIITDHHRCPEELPRAAAVVNPQRSGGEAANLSGVGVAFKLICALEGDTAAVLERYSDLAALGTVADVMPLVGENRALVFSGLEKFLRDPRPGLEALIREAGAGEKPLNASALGYTLAPRINAAGRLCRTREAVELILCSDPEQAESSAARLCSLNKKRQELEAEVWQEALEMLEKSPPHGPIVLAGESWHPGVVGIAASRLAEEFEIPAVIICLDGELGKGSCRSWGDFNIFEGLAACSKHLEGYGGHAYAAGLTVKRDKIDDFRLALMEYYQSHAHEVLRSPEAELILSDPDLLTMENVQSLDALEPCGSGNPRPVFCLRDIMLESVASIGGGKHLRLRLGRNRKSLEGVFFSMTPETLGIRQGETADVCFIPQINEFRGRRSVQLLITAMRPSAAEKECADILAGAEPPEDTRLCRQDMELIWRSLKKRGQSFGISFPGIISGEEMRETDPQKFCLGLRIFQEIELLSFSINNGILSICLTDNGQRKDLEKSPLFKRLSGNV